MATARANRQHWLSPAGRSLWAVPVSGLLLFLLVIGGPATLLPLAYEHVSTPAHNESEPEDIDEDDTATAAPPFVIVSCFRKTKGGFSPTPSDATSCLLNAGALPQSRLLIPAQPVGAFAKQNGAGISMRC